MVVERGLGEGPLVARPTLAAAATGAAVAPSYTMPSSGSRPFSALTDHYYFSDAAAADYNEGSNEGQEDPETLALCPVLLAIILPRITTTATTTIIISTEHKDKQHGKESRALALKRMQKLFMALENLSV